MDAPVRAGNGPHLFAGHRDVENGTDIVTGYAHVNGKRTVYIPVTNARTRPRWPSSIASKRRCRDASGRAAGREDQPRVRPIAVCRRRDSQPDHEGVLGALLTGLMVLLFLRDWRSALIVSSPFPFALFVRRPRAVGVRPTINIMTLGGLALAVGVLVDEATVEIENIHTHMSAGFPGTRRAGCCQ